MQNSSIKTRLIILSFMQFAIWGAYLTSMGRYLGSAGMGSDIGWFYSVQGIVSIFMPAIMGVIADRWVPAQRLLAFCHAMAAVFMAITGYIGMRAGAGVTFGDIFGTYTVAVAFYMPTLALSNSVSYTALENAGLDTVQSFPPIRVFGTIGFISYIGKIDVESFFTGNWLSSHFAAQPSQPHHIQQLLCLLWQRTKTVNQSLLIFEKSVFAAQTI